jgi:intein/homing endonuclease
MNAKLAYLAGLISGDGHLELGRNRVDIRIYPRGFRRTVFRLARSLGKDANVVDKGRKVRITSKEFVRTLVLDYEIPKGSKSKTMDVSSSIRKAPLKIQNAYVAGWYDAEGWVETDRRRNPPYSRIRFCVANGKVCEFILEVLRKNRLGRAMFSSGERYCVDINGNDKCGEFFSKIPVLKIGMPLAY